MDRCTGGANAANEKVYVAANTARGGKQTSGAMLSVDGKQGLEKRVFALGPTWESLIRERTSNREQTSEGCMFGLIHGHVAAVPGARWQRKERIEK